MHYATRIATIALNTITAYLVDVIRSNEKASLFRAGFHNSHWKNFSKFLQEQKVFLQLHPRTQNKRNTTPQRA